MALSTAAARLMSPTWRTHVTAGRVRRRCIEWRHAAQVEQVGFVHCKLTRELDYLELLSSNEIPWTVSLLSLYLSLVPLTHRYYFGTPAHWAGDWNVSCRRIWSLLSPHCPRCWPLLTHSTTHGSRGCSCLRGAGNAAATVE